MTEPRWTVRREAVTGHPSLYRDDVHVPLEEVADLLNAETVTPATGGGWEASKRDEGGH